MKPFRQTLFRGPVVQVPRCELSVGKQRVAPWPIWSRRSSLSSEGAIRHRCTFLLPTAHRDGSAGHSFVPTGNVHPCCRPQGACGQGGACFRHTHPQLHCGEHDMNSS